MSISAQDVAKLREMTGMGMMDCKKALDEADGDFDKAVEILRKKGAKTALKRAEKEAKEGFIASYTHNGRIGVLLELNSETDFVAKNDEFRDLAKELAMQVAAMNPRYLAPRNVPSEEIEKEKEIEAEKLKESGKPEDIIAKILEGKTEKYYSENCLLRQAFFKDEKKTIESLINDLIAKVGEKITVGRYVRFEIGDISTIS